MEIPRPSDEDKQRFRSLVPEGPTIEIKPMFGNLGAFVSGNMFMGLFGPSVGVKLSEADREELLAAEGAGPFGPPERPMSGYVSLPSDLDDQAASEWAERALAHMAQAPPKQKKARKT